MENGKGYAGCGLQLAACSLQLAACSLQLALVACIASLGYTSYNKVECNKSWLHVSFPGVVASFASTAYRIAISSYLGASLGAVRFSDFLCVF